MSKETLHPARLLPTAAISAEEYNRKFLPSIQNAPDLPAVNWGALGLTAPTAIDAGGESPKADAIVFTWADSEWAAMQQVFCGNAPMPYSSRNTSDWPGWVKYSAGAPNEVGYWGNYRLVQLGGAKILLFKSNVHFSEKDGKQNLTALVDRLIHEVQPQLMLSIGTAGGARLGDHIGTVNIVDADTLYISSEPQTDWQTFTSAWRPCPTLLNQASFNQLLLPIPTDSEDIGAIVADFNQFYDTNYKLSELDPDGLNFGTPSPAMNDLTSANVPLLTANSFVVATTDGNLSGFACVEMDDAVIAEACANAHQAFGSIRNISDPAQNSTLPSQMQGHWGEAIYTAYGFYTSYNGALVAAAALAAQFNPND